MWGMLGVSIVGLAGLPSCGPADRSPPERDAAASTPQAVPDVTEPGVDPASASEPTEAEQGDDPAVSLDARIARGAVVFFENCASCHQGEGEGVATEVPPLAESDFLNEDKARAIDIVVNGLDGEVVVNGHEFAGRMPSLGLSDDDIADVLTYVFSQWGNTAQVVLPEEVVAARR